MNIPRQRNWRPVPLPLRLIALALIPLQIITPIAPQILQAAQIPVAQTASSGSQPPLHETPPPAPKVNVNHTVPAVKPPSTDAIFPANPGDFDIMRAHVFAGQLIPATAGSATEDQDLAQALTAFLQRTSSDDFSAITTFLDSHPQSVWRISLLTELGLAYRQSGWFSKALDCWEQAWALGKDNHSPAIKPVADRAVGELLELNARLGRYDRLEQLFGQTKGRILNSAVMDKVAGAREGLWLMQNRPEVAFRCGPMALNQILASEKPQEGTDKLIITSHSTTNGISLASVCDLANRLGMNYQMAKRQPGSKVIFPSVVNWKVGHYAALIREDNGRYLVQDPTFGDEIWVSPAALDAEASGYFLVPAGDLPSGWTPVNTSEGQLVWGKGNTDNSDKNRTGTNAPTTCPNIPGPKMAEYNFNKMLASLHIADAPLGYNPPRGGSVQFQLYYNQREANQPDTFGYSNMGQKWDFNWLAYIQDNPSASPGSQDVYFYQQGGGTEVYSGASFNTTNQSYGPDPDEHALLVRSSPTNYIRYLPNGSKEIYGVPNAPTNASFRNVFLTQLVDPAGNTMTYNYDSGYRLVSAVDALGQVSTISYEAEYAYIYYFTYENLFHQFNTVYAYNNDPNFLTDGGDGSYFGSEEVVADGGYANPAYYQIAQVTDPFGRSASFAYNTNGELQQITDIMGIKSQFTYTNSDDGTPDFINSMTTPYGTTYFSEGVNGRNAWLEAMDPMGQKERVEYVDQISANEITDMGGITPTNISADVQAGDTATNYLIFRNSFYWDKLAMQLYPGDYTKAHIDHWLHTSDLNTCSDTLESSKDPLEDRIWYTYPGQPSNDTYQQGTNNQPASVARVLGDGSTQIYKYQYNSFGQVTQTVDPIGRTTLYNYATNLVDLLSVQQLVGTNDVTLSSYTYNTNHEMLTTTDAAGNTTSMGYNAFGQMIAITNALSQVQTMAYDANGYLTNVTSTMPGSTKSFTYDGFGRERTVTDSEGYTVTTSYDINDRPTNIAYPDGTYEQIVYDNLDPVLTKDRLGHWTSKMYDPLRRLTDIYDNLGRHTQFAWCGCGSLESITDPLGHVTSWMRDVEGRVTSKDFYDGTSLNYLYETNTSRLKSMTDAKGQVTQYQYYVDNNPHQVSYSNAVVATPAVSFVYDTNFNRIVSMTDGTGTTAYNYYAITNGQLGAGMLSSVAGPLGNSTITYIYDQLGRTSTRAINGIAQALTYDALGRITVITNVLGAFTNTYVDTTPRLASISYPNGQTTSYSYYSITNDERLQQIQNLNSSGQNLSSFNYAYDVDGNITNWTQQVDTNTPTAYSYGYDQGNQLLNAVLKSTGAGAAVLKHFAYGYDQAGNRTSEQIGMITNAPVEISESSYNEVNELTSRSASGGPVQFAGYTTQPATVTVAGNQATVNHQTTNFTGYATVGLGTNNVAVVATGYNTNVNSQTNIYQLVVTNNGVAESLAYDLNGNVTSVVTATSTNTYQWDAVNRLVGITGPTNQSVFVYDGLGRRTQIIESTNGLVYATNNFVWDGQALAEQRDNTGTNVTRRFFGQGEQIAGNSYYFTRDHLGSVREMTDGTRTIHARYDYDPYGRVTKISGDMDSDFMFTGVYFHAPSGLFLTLYRAYNSDLGRWLSRDPSGESGGLNLYDYVSNNPIDFFDMYGLVRWTQLFTGVAALLGGAAVLAIGASTAVTGIGVPLAVSGAIAANYGAINIVASIWGYSDEVAEEAKNAPSSLGQTVGAVSGQIFDGSEGEETGKQIGGLVEDSVNLIHDETASDPEVVDLLGNTFDALNALVDGNEFANSSDKVNDDVENIPKCHNAK